MLSNESNGIVTLVLKVVVSSLNIDSKFKKTCVISKIFEKLYFQVKMQNKYLYRNYFYNYVG